MPSMFRTAKILVFLAIGMEPKRSDYHCFGSGFCIIDACIQSIEDVVVAMVPKKKESITGSVAKIGAEQLETRLTWPNILPRRFAGAALALLLLRVTDSLQQRCYQDQGFGSINASNNPLFVVDGFPYEGYIGDLNTNDIESISLLKDASSTALYGKSCQRCGIITTKKGKAGSPKVNLSVNNGSQRGIAE